jgi:phosphoheptose isomerase
MKPYVVLDRDGTIIVEKNYLASPDQVQLLPNAAAGLRRFHEMGYGLVLLTNQSGVGRGYFSETAVNAVHRRLNELLTQEGVRLDGVYFCPHAPENDCSCRKPRAGLFERAVAELDLDPAASIVIGDKPCDIDLGRSVGLTTVLVRTGYGTKYFCDGAIMPDFVANDLLNASEIVANHKNATVALFPGASLRFRHHFAESVRTKQRVVAECEDEILAAASTVAGALRQGNKILFCGNGGSAADCQHIAAEFVSVLTQDFLRPGLPAIALTTDTSILTASANDFGFEGVFRRQVQALSNPGDVLVGISTSGNSENVLGAIHYGRENELRTIGLTGATGGKLAGAADIVIRVPSRLTMHIQEAHIAIGHVICDLVERTLFSHQSSQNGDRPSFISEKSLQGTRLR